MFRFKSIITLPFSPQTWSTSKSDWNLTSHRQTTEELTEWRLWVTWKIDERLTKGEVKKRGVGRPFFQRRIKNRWTIYRGWGLRTIEKSRFRDDTAYLRSHTHGVPPSPQQLYGAMTPTRRNGLPRLCKKSISRFTLLHIRGYVR